MALAIPLLIMVVALASAWALGMVAKGRPIAVQQAIGAFGVAILMLSPLAYEASIFDGTCYAGAGAKPEPCALAVRLATSFRDGFAFMLAPALLWVLVYIMAINTPAGQAKTK